MQSAAGDPLAIAFDEECDLPQLVDVCAEYLRESIQQTRGLLTRQRRAEQPAIDAMQVAFLRTNVSVVLRHGGRDGGTQQCECPQDDEQHREWRVQH